MIRKWTKVCIQVIENALVFCISVNNTESRIEKHTSKESMEYSINDWIRYYVRKGTEFEILRYR